AMSSTLPAGCPFSRSCTMVTPPATAAATVASRSLTPSLLTMKQRTGRCSRPIRAGNGMSFSSRSNGAPGPAGLADGLATSAARRHRDPFGGAAGAGDRLFLYAAGQVSHAAGLDAQLEGRGHRPRVLRLGNGGVYNDRVGAQLQGEGRFR